MADDLLPLIAGVVRFDGDVVHVDVGLETVTIEGGAALARGVLGDCDGQTTLAHLAARHGAQAPELVELLMQRGALVDAPQAWRVLHRQSSAGTALGRAADDETVLALQRAAFRPARLDGVPVALTPPAGAVAALAGARRSAHPADPAAAELTFAGLSSLLGAAYGMARDEAGYVVRAAVPSGGAMYPLIVHVLIREALAPLEPGLWWLDPAAHALERVRGTPCEADDLFVPEPVVAALVAERAPIVFLSADVSRPAGKYGPRAYRYAMIEAGAAMQSAALAAAELGVGMRPIGGIDDGRTHAFLELGDDAVALLALLLRG